MIRERPLADLRDFQRDLLIAVSLNDGEDGQTVKADLKDIRGEEVHHERLYDNLNALVERGLIHKDRRPGLGNEYRLSEYGAEQLEDERQWFNGVVRN